MPRLLISSLIATLHIATPAFAQQAIPEKQIALPASGDLVVGHQAREGRAVLVELVPKGETVKSYTKMVTLQTMPGMGNVPENAFLDEFAKRYAAACPNTKVIKVPFGEQGLAGLRIDCPTHPATGKTETVFVRAIDMDEDLGLVHITLRYFPMPQDGQWARDYLGEVAMR